MQKKLKRIFALICAFTLLATTVFGNGVMRQAKAAEPQEAVPVTLDGYTNVTIKDFSKNSVQMPEGAYACTDATYGNYDSFTLTDGTSMDNKLFDVNVTFTKGGGSAERIDIAGSGDWSGFMVYPSNDGSYLYVVSNTAYGTTSEWQHGELSATNAGVTSFLNNEFLLQLSFDFGTVGGDNKADILVGIYVNGVKRTEHTFTGCNMAKFGGAIGIYRQATGAVVAVNSVTLPKEITPVYLEGFNHITLRDFKDVQGNEMEAGEYEGASTGAHKDFYADGLANFDDTVLSMKVKFEAGSYKNSLILAGTHGWQGFNIHPNNDGSQLVVDKTWISGMTSSETPTLSADVAGVGSFLNEEFILQLSFEYSDAVDGKSDLTLGIYINGELYSNQKFTIAGCSTSAIGTVFAPYRQDDGKSIFLENVEVKAPGPVQLEGFDNITLQDFKDVQGNVMEAGEYEGNSGGAHKDYYATGLSNFDKKVLSIKVMFEAGSYKNSLILAGTHGWQGFNIHPNNDGSQLVVDKTWISGMTSSETPTLSADVAGVESFLNKEFILQLSFEYSEPANGQSDLTLGIYINGSLYNNQKFTIAACNTSAIGTVFAPYRQDDGKSIFLDNVIVGEDTGPDTPDEPAEIVPVELDGFTNLTIRDFVDKNGAQMPIGEYEGNSGGANNDYYVENLANFDKHLLSMKITYEGGEYKHSLVVGGTGEWSGFNLRPNGDGSILFIDSSWAGSIIDKSTYVAPYMTAELAGIDSFIGEEILLQLSFEYGEVVNGKADLTIGVYINGHLYNDAVFTIPDCTVSAMGSHLALYRGVDGSSIIVDNVILDEDTPDVPDTPIVPNEQLEKITFSNFGILDDVYPYVDGDLCIRNSLQDKDSIAGTLFEGDIAFNGGGHFQMIFGGVGSAWDGLRVIVENNNEINLYWYQGSNGQHVGYTNTDLIGSEFIGPKLNVKLSMEVVGNDIQVGLWINDVAVSDDYIVIANGASQLGNKFGVYSSDSAATVTIGESRKESEQPNPDLEKVTFSHFGIVSDTYNYNGDLVISGSLENKDSVAGTVLCGDIELSGSGHFQVILGGGKNAWNGIRLVSDNADALHVWWYEGTNGTHITSFYSEDADVSFQNENITIMISTEAVGNDIKLGVWFNGALYNNEYFIIEGKADKLENGFAAYCANEAASVILASDPDLAGGDEPDTPDTPDEPELIVPVELEGFEDVTISDLVDASGQSMEDRTYAGDAAGAMDAFSWKNGTSFDRVLLNMNVEFTAGGGNNRIDVAGNGEWSGFSVFASNSGEYLHIYTNYGFADPAVSIDMSATTAEVETFLEKEFLLQLSMQLVDSDSDGTTDDLEVGVYINGTLYNDAVQMIPNINLSKFGDYVGLYREGTDKAITVGSVGGDASDETEQPNPDLEKVTFDQYGIDDGTYEYNGDLVVQGTLSDKSTIAGTVLCGDIELSGSGHFQVILGGGENAWDGIRFVSDNANAIHVYWYEGTTGTHYGSFTPADANVSFRNETITMMISTELVDNDGDGNANDIKLGVWFNGVLYNNEYIIIANKGDKLENKFAAYCADSAASVILASDPELKDEDTPDEPVNPDVPTEIGPDGLEGFDNLTLKHFTDAIGTVMKAGEYSSGVSDEITSSINKHYSVDGLTSFDNKLLSMKVKLSNASYRNSIVIGGAGEWKGFNIHAAANGTQLVIDNSWAGSIATLTPIIMDASVAGVNSFLNEEFLLQISFEYGEEVSGVADLTMGVYIDGNLYNNEQFTIENCNMSNSGSGLALYVEEDSEAATIITVGNVWIGEEEPDEPVVPDEPQQPNEDFEKLTFAHFSVKDGTYPYNGDIVVRGALKGKDSLDKTVICGDVLLDGSGSFQLLFGGQEDTWDGLRLIVGNADSMHLYWFNDDGAHYFTTYTSDIAGTAFVGEEFNLMLSTEVVGDDIQFGIWFNGVLYNNQYAIFKGFADELGNMFGVYCEGTDASASLNSIPELMPPVEPPKKPNPDFEKITFDFFGLKDGTYKYDGTVAATFEGKGNDSLDEKVLCGDVLFSGKGENHFMVGGNGNTWYAFRFITQENGTIVLYWIDDAGLQLVEIFDATAAGATLVGEWLNLMISTEVLDADGDGVEDDIELGVWFNGVLYKEQYYTVLDKASGLGSQFGFDCMEEDNSISIRSIPEFVRGFNYEAYGLTKDWEKTLLTDHKAGTAVGGSRDAEPFAGDLFKISTACLFGAAAVVAMLVGAYTIMRRKKES